MKNGEIILLRGIKINYEILTHFNIALKALCTQFKSLFTPVLCYCYVKLNCGYRSEVMGCKSILQHHLPKPGID